MRPAASCSCISASLGTVLVVAQAPSSHLDPRTFLFQAACQQNEPCACKRAHVRGGWAEPGQLEIRLGLHTAGGWAQCFWRQLHWEHLCPAWNRAQCAQHRAAQLPAAASEQRELKPLGFKVHVNAGGSRRDKFSLTPQHHLCNPKGSLENGEKSDLQLCLSVTSGGLEGSGS